jgi:predicted site-specific integrase-resolvase
MVETHPEKRLVGYARVSTYGQTLDSQLEQLRAAGCSNRNIYREKATGTSLTLHRKNHVSKECRTIDKPGSYKLVNDLTFSTRRYLPVDYRQLRHDQHCMWLRA